ncbi:MAG: hypothetical protein IPI30_22475, partial [Saprospiraceae bacterium]|nr:hypothetical protein [Candidatus Vicinibacter affinis]
AISGKETAPNRLNSFYIDGQRRKVGTCFQAIEALFFHKTWIPKGIARIAAPDVRLESWSETCSRIFVLLVKIHTQYHGGRPLSATSH